MKRLLLAAALGTVSATVWAGFNLGMTGAVKSKAKDLDTKVTQAAAQQALISGTAAGGRPLGTQTLTAENCGGITKTVTTGADGSFSLNVTGAAFPLLLQVKGPPNYYGIAYGAGTNNVDPFTDLALKTYYRSSRGITTLDASFTANFSTLCVNGLSPQTSLNIVTSVVLNSLTPVMARSGLDPATYNPFTTAFSADGIGFDAVLDSAAITANADYSTVTIKDVATGIVLSTITAPLRDLSTPAGPTGLAFSGITHSTITLRWTASVSTGAAGYGVYRNAVLLTNVSTTTFTDKNLAAGTTYNYRLDAFNWTGNRSTQTASLPAATAGVLTVFEVGFGTVTSVPAGINCGATCSADYALGTSVVLTASATANSYFTGWTGAGCSGTGTCTVTAAAAASVTAAFAPNTLTVAKGGLGTGTVTSNVGGINCGAACSANYNVGASVVLTATAPTGSYFGGWSGGGCSGVGTCTVTMTSATAVTATFNLPANVTVTVWGSGTVTSAPGGINCGSGATCSALFNAPATLTAVASANFGFGGWSGACAGTDTCSVTISTTVYAHFLPLGILVGAVNYTGALPPTANVHFTDAVTMQISTVTAFPGMVQVFFDTTTVFTSAQAQAVFNTYRSGVVILGKVPLIGYYLVQVPAGAEDTLIAPLHGDSRVKLAIPNLAVSLDDAVVINDTYMANPTPVPLFLTGPTGAPGNPIFDPPAVVDLGDDGDGHQTQVASGATGAGEPFTAFISGDLVLITPPGSHFPITSSALMVNALAGVAQSNNDPSNPMYINMSNGPGFHLAAGGQGDVTDTTLATPQFAQQVFDARYNDLCAKLQAIANLPPALANTIVLSLAAGNNNMDIGPMLQKARSNPEYARILQNNTLMCGTDRTLTPPFPFNYKTGVFANHATNDPDFVKSNNAEVITAQDFGTSFASPACLADVKQIVDQTHVSPSAAILALKRAASANGGAIVLSQAIAAARTPALTADYRCQVTNLSNCSFLYSTIPPDVDDTTPPTVDDLNAFGLNPVTGTVTNLADCNASFQARASNDCTINGSISPDGNDFWRCSVQFQAPDASNCH